MIALKKQRVPRHHHVQQKNRESGTTFWASKILIAGSKRLHTSQSLGFQSPECLHQNYIDLLKRKDVYLGYAI